MKKYALFGVLALAMASTVVMAHGPAKAQYGGIVQTAGDLSFELVTQGTGAVIYVVDHDKPADVRNATGKLTVLNGTEQSEGEIKPSQGNKLEVANVKLGKGAKAVAAISGLEGKTVTVRFTVPSK